MHRFNVPFVLACVLLCGIFATSAIPVTPADGKVLVLGSGGLIGSALVKWLHANHYETIEVENRESMDLREPGALDRFSHEAISFVYFLACEVGGSKFIDSSSSEVQLSIITHNLAIYQSVFPWLASRKIPFVFTSSYLQSQSTPYGTIKRLGENWIASLGFGRVVRLWNIYGYEEIGPKSHVLTDWTSSCVKHQKIECQTDGTEARQFLHSDDCAAALGSMMTIYEASDLVTDISSDQWVTLRECAALIQNISSSSSSSSSSSLSSSPEPCEIRYSDRKGTARARLAPNTTAPLYQVWTPTITLEEGIRQLYHAYSKEHAASIAQAQAQAQKKPNHSSRSTSKQEL